MALLGEVATPILETRRRGQTGHMVLPKGSASGGRAGLILTSGRTICSELGATFPESPATQARPSPGAQRREAVKEAAFPQAVSEKLTEQLVCLPRRPWSLSQCGIPPSLPPS